MSAQLVARGLGAAHGARTLFSSLDLVLAPGDVLGVVGANGAGKSTLLRLLAGIGLPDAGTVTRAPADATVGLLPQESDRRAGESVIGQLARRTGVAEAHRALEAATAALAAGETGADDRYSTALERWLTLGAADLEDRADGVAARVGLDVRLDHPMTALSGGQAARVGLMALLLSRHDILLLDEPTNDLDLAGLAMLEQLVRATPAPVALISHDREFMSRTVTNVLELDLHQQEVHLYGGGFDAYLTEREVRRTTARDRYEDYRDTVDTLRERARTQRAWADKGASTARRDRSERDKFIRHHDISTSEQLAATARRTDRMIERLEEVAEPRREWDLRLSIAHAPPSGRVVAALDSAEVALGDFRLGPVTLQINRGDRVAVTGPNGSGKSTLLALMLGTLAPDAGRVHHGAAVQVGEIDQARGQFSGAATLLDAVCAALPGAPTSQVRTLLAKFGLRSEHLDRPAGTASPGERTRAALALFQGRGVNLLVLDEPTNHLDLPAIEQLEVALDSFDGTVVLVTHDRRLLVSFRADRHLLLDQGAVTEQ